MKLKIIAKIIAKTFAVVFRRLNSYITAAIRAPQLKSTHTPKGRRLVSSKMLKISKNIVSVAIKKKTSSRQAPLRVREREKTHIGSHAVTSQNHVGAHATVTPPHARAGLCTDLRFCNANLHICRFDIHIWERVNPFNASIFFSA